MRPPVIAFGLPLALSTCFGVASPLLGSSHRGQTPLVLGSGFDPHSGSVDREDVNSVKCPDSMYAWRFNTSSVVDTREIMRVAKVGAFHSHSEVDKANRSFWMGDLPL